MENLLVVPKSDTKSITTHHTFTHIMLGYLFLKYACGIHDINYRPYDNGDGENSPLKETLGMLTVSSDGMLIFRAVVTSNWNDISTHASFLVQHFSDKQEKMMTFHDIKQMLIRDLRKELIK